VAAVRAATASATLAVAVAAGPTAGSGARGNAGVNATTNATGGTQSQGGNGGVSSLGTPYKGADATDVVLDWGADGGETEGLTSHGGGGGGGGYHPGGGGQASGPGYAPGGGGGGGSSYAGGLTQAAVGQPGNGLGTGDGGVTITWTAPSPANQPPSAPTAVHINGVDEADDLPTKAKRVTVSAVLNDPNGNKVRMLVSRSATAQLPRRARRQGPG
jgi:hypothetical protein